jgi:hypothetical protein
MGAVLRRALASLAGAILMFAVWLVAVLVRMPRPPVPPSFTVTLTAPVFTAGGFALGIAVVERFTRPRRRTAGGTFVWTWAGGTIGAASMFPLGGMMAGFGLLGLGAATMLAREVLAVVAGGSRRPTTR